MRLEINIVIKFKIEQMCFNPMVEQKCDGNHHIEIIFMSI